MSAVEAVRAQLFAPGAAPSFAVLDAARDEQIDRITLGFELRSLYLLDGVVDPALQRVAPRVVELDPAPSIGIDRLIEGAQGASWGYFVRSRAGLLDVRDQLASLLVAELPDGSVVRFRAFDPRVMRVFLPTCEASEHGRVFGPIEDFLIEAPGSERLTCHARDSSVHEGPARFGGPPPHLLLSGAQVDALHDHARAGFDARMLVHLRRFFPAQCEALSAAELGVVLAHGVARARRYGLVTEAEICKYFNLMFSFGRDFDVQQGWAVRVLAGRQRGDEALIERLYALALANESRALGRV